MDTRIDIKYVKYVNYGMFKLHSFKNGYTFGYCYKILFMGLQNISDSIF